jgi:deoxyribonuclease-4
MRQRNPMIGAHMSIAGGYHKAVVAGADLDMNVVQIFTKNNNQWRAKPITDGDVEQFSEALSKYEISHPLSHASYLINLASPDATLRKKSIDAFVIELQRAERLGISFVVLHPGSFTTSSEETGLKTIIQSLDEVHRQTSELQAQCLLENTAGQGSNLGWRFEQLATILDGVQQPERLGVCFDTCHAFAAGYPLTGPKDYKATMKQLNSLVGIERVRAIHLNDSKREFGSRVDRHEHIGKGEIGIEGFRNLLNDRRFRKTPMYLETPKGEDEGQQWDAINLETLRSLVE